MWVALCPCHGLSSATVSALPTPSLKLSGQELVAYLSSHREIDFGVWGGSGWG